MEKNQETDTIDSGLIELLEKYISEGMRLSSSLAESPWKEVQRIELLARKLDAEVQFLRKVENSWKKDPSLVKKEHILCSNMLSLAKHVEFLQSGIKPLSVLKPFYFLNETGAKQKISVDIVADAGQVWYKVVARNPKSLHRASLGDCEFGQKSILHQAQDFISCSSQNLVHYRQPKVVFLFFSGITSKLASKLENLGITVSGDRLDFNDIPSPEISDSESDSEPEPVDYTRIKTDDESEEIRCLVCLKNTSKLKIALERILFDFEGYSSFLPSADGVCLCSSALKERDRCLNIDVTAMVVFVSSLTNGRHNFRFNEKIIDEQAHWERLRPAKKLLNQLCAGKQLVSCEKAVIDFVEIVATIGGEGERARARDLLSSMIFVPDCPSDAALQLKCTGSVSERGKIIFGTGDRLKMVTLSANTGFLRSALSQGVQFAFLEHEPRVLTEKKEKTAVPLELQTPSVEPEGSVHLM